MAYTDRADFVIADTRIHGGLLAWKLTPAKDETRAAARVFSIRAFSRSFTAANADATPTGKQSNFKPTEFNRSAFGKAPPVSTGPQETG